MLSHVFYRHGRLCASHPWEVIIAFLTLLSWKLSIGNAQVGSSKICDYECSEENKGVEMVLLSIARCVAILYCIHQFIKLNKLGSTFLVTIGGLYTFFCLVPCFVFATNITNLFGGDFSEVKKALPFFFLLMDITKAGLLAQFALSSSNQEEVRENIAQGMSILGPTITLDTIVETLVIGVGTLSGVRKLEELCRFACMSAVINYFVFMVFFPACLALILELARDRDEGRPIWHLSTLTRILQQEEEQKPNPVLQRVKVIMSAGLVLVHAHSRWPLLVASKALQHVDKENQSYTMNHSNWDIYVQKWFGSAEQMVMVAFACTFAVMYHYLESRDDLSEHLASAAISSPSKCPINYQSSFSPQPVQSTPYEGSLWSQESILTSCSKPCNPIPYYKDIHSVSFIVGADDRGEKPPHSISEKSIQTDSHSIVEKFSEPVEPVVNAELRSIEECKEILQSEVGGEALTDEELMVLAEKKIIQAHKLETIVRNPNRGVVIRRKLITKDAKRGQIFDSVPYCDYDYKLLMGSCCENVVGYMPVPLGVAGPLILDGEPLYVPLATTEGCLVASINRGCRALSLCGGVRSTLLGDGMTRAPVIRLPSEIEAGAIKKWTEVKENYEILKAAFDSTSRFARLQSIDVQVAGRLAFLRFKAVTGDAMGMNMLSKGSEEALNKLRAIFPCVEIVSLSGNYCTDKKPAAVNWIQGRGKQVVCGAVVPGKIIKEILKTDVSALTGLNVSKNYVGSALAGSIGGFNAQSANIVTAIYIATGQDAAQNVTSSNCITQIELTGPENKDLYISCTMPSIEVGTVGGGTFLPAQASCLELMGVKGPCEENPGNNAAKLARIVCATVLAGELSLLSALVEGDLVRSHMTHNRSSANVQSSATPQPSIPNVLVNVNPLTQS